MNNLIKYLNIKYLVGIGILFFIFLVYYFLEFVHNKEAVVVESSVKGFETVNIMEESKVHEETTAHNIKVHITGEVINSGVYEIVQGSRVIDVLELAGGPAENADLQKVNLARYIEDAEQIIIPKVKDDFNMSDMQMEINNSSTLININTATKEELMKLPNVGEVTSLSIIDYRENKGNFKTIEDIKKVSGIGTKTFDRLKDLITV